MKYTGCLKNQKIQQIPTFTMWIIFVLVLFYNSYTINQISCENCFRILTALILYNNKINN